MLGQEPPRPLPHQGSVSSLVTRSRTTGSQWLPVVLFALISAVSGCAGGAGTEHDAAELRRDLNAIMAANQRARMETEAQMAQRSREQAAETSRQLAALSGRLDAIAGDLNRMSTRLDDLSRRVDGLRAQAARPAAPARPETRVPTPVAPLTPATPSPAPPPSTAPAAPSAVAPPASPAAPPASPAPPPASPAAPGSGTSARVVPPPPAGPPRATAGAPTAEESYQAAFSDLTRGRYPLAIEGFREFLRRHPDSPLADSAQYGIGEAYFSAARASANQGQSDRARREWEQAALEFRKVSVNYPRGGKVPTALYKEALALGEIKQTALSRIRLQYLIDTFPQSAEAPLAKERLGTLKP